jgi:hypothetical protein
MLSGTTARILRHSTGGDGGVPPQTHTHTRIVSFFVTRLISPSPGPVKWTVGPGIRFNFIIQTITHTHTRFFCVCCLLLIEGRRLHGPAAAVAV